MPAMVIAEQTSGKRKRSDQASAGKNSKPRKAAKLDNGDDLKSRILQLEDDISVAEKRREALEELFTILQDDKQRTKIAVLAAVTLCRAFTRSITSETGTVANNQPATEISGQSMQDSIQDFIDILHTWIGSPDAVKENTAVTLVMRIVKEQVFLETKRADEAWRTPSSTFVTLIARLLESPEAEGARQLFVEKYLEEHDDVRYFTFMAIATVMKEEDNEGSMAANALDLLAQIEGILDSQDQLQDWYGPAPQSEKATLLSLKAHRKAAHQAWIALFSVPLTHDHRRKILSIMNSRILPWFSTRLEVLTDFLTDSFNTAGPTAVLALGGIFHLITVRNIDYPDFYRKLYSLLDEDILHSKSRNNFLRLLDRCMSSSHLPAALIASFVKRLARLALQAPPGAIVWIVPWTYNLLQQHPSCTYMIHRVEHPSHAVYAAYPNPAETGMRDPFDIKEPDPMLTRAIDSSLWELQTLQSHYHPNVATLACIISEQFTKRDYQLEDFLDHSYGTLLDGELSRDLKKEPEVEWEIPKRIITTEDGLNPLGSMLQQAVDAC